jgi:hypothetical protein
MPCSLSNARARHVPVNACPTVGSCCDTSTSFSTQSVCCGENFDQEWTPYDIQITATTTNPGYTLAPGSIAAYKIVGKSLFVKFLININQVFSIGAGNYIISLPFSDNGNDVGTIVLFINNVTTIVQGTLIQNNDDGLYVLIPSTIPSSDFWSPTNLPIIQGGIYYGDIHIRLL